MTASTENANALVDGDVEVKHGGGATHPVQSGSKKRPVGLKWRSSIWFATLVAGCGMAVDVFVYGAIIPVIPFQLERLGHSPASSSTLTGWLLFIYCAGIVLSTPPAAIVSERTNSRQGVLVAGSIFMIGGQIIFMEAPAYWVMCIARLIQGVGSTCIWVAGLALVCDVTPEAFIGAQLGTAMSGLTVGLLAGPPLGGVLYSKLGFRAPFIMGIIIIVIDLIGRLVIVERKIALRWGVDPWEAWLAAEAEKERKKTEKEKEKDAGEGKDAEKGTVQDGKEGGVRDAKGRTSSPDPVTDTETLHPPVPASTASAAPLTAATLLDPHQPPDAPSPPNVLPQTEKTDHGTTVDEASAAPPSQPKPLSTLGVIVRLGGNARAMASLFCIFTYGISLTAQEPPLPLHLQAIWGYDSTKVGLVWIASVVPTIFSPILAGMWADKIGAEWITAGSLLGSLPFWCMLIVDKSIAIFIVALVCESFFTAAMATVLTMELAAVSRNLEGVGYAHVYGAFNLVFGLGGVVGPIAGGQLYAHAAQGWTAVCLLGVGLVAVSILCAVLYMGDTSVVKQTRNWMAGRRVKDQSSTVESTIGVEEVLDGGSVEEKEKVGEGVGAREA